MVCMNEWMDGCLGVFNVSPVVVLKTAFALRTVEIQSIELL